MDIVGGQHLRQMWDDLAGIYEDKTALIFESCAGEVQHFSYAALNRDQSHGKPFLFPGRT